jgi:drug/metabolite transporter (DMT)-like permease
VLRTINPPQGWLFQYFLLAFVWGSSFAYTEAGLSITSPIGITATRHIIGSLALAVLLLMLGQLPKLKNLPSQLLRRLFVLAMLLNVIPGTLFAFAQNHVSTVIAAIINSATPIMTLVMIAVVFRQEKLIPRQIIGLFTGLIGALIALGVGFSDLGENEPIGVAALILAISCYGFAIPYARNKVTPLGYSPMIMAHVQVLLAAVVLAILFVLEVSFFGIPAFTAPSSPWILGQVLILGLGTGIAYIWHFQVLERAGSAIASSITYPTLVVSLVIGWIVLSEPFSWNMPLGALVIAMGSVITQRIRVVRRRQRSPSLQSPQLGEGGTQFESLEH